MFPGEMAQSTTDDYAVRIKEVQQELETLGWSKAREDEWRSPQGDKIRFSYATKEFRIHTEFKGQPKEWHALHIREDLRMPEVHEILESIIEIGRSLFGRVTKNGHAYSK